MKINYYLIICLFSLQIGHSQECPDTCKYFIPNIISPDCDGCERLEILSNCEFIDFEFIVYNKWAEIVFNSSDVSKKMDSSNYSEDVYFWKLTVRFCTNEQINDTGQITVLR